MSTGPSGLVAPSGLSILRDRWGETPDYGAWRTLARPSQLPPSDWTSTWYVRGGRGGGKALALDTPIPTPTGWSTMGDLQVGDHVLDEQGKPCRVTYATAVQLGNVCFEVVFSDGTTVIADAEHLWLTMTKAARKAAGRTDNPQSGPQLRTTAEIATTLRHNDGREVNHSVLLAAPLELAEADLPIPPYVLGVWLGDGTSRDAGITVSDADRDELLSQLAADGVLPTGPPQRKPGAACTTQLFGGKPTARLNGRIVANGSLHTKLRVLGVLNNKHVPTAYLRASLTQREAILAGLMDTDGHAQEKGSVEFTATRERLALDVFELAASLGHKPTMRTGRSTLNGVDHGPKYRVSWTPDRPVFRLTRKLARQRTALSQNCRNQRRYIIDVRPAPTVPVRCITVDSPSRLYLCTAAMIPTHNTWTVTNAFAEIIKRHPVDRDGIPTEWGVVAPTFADGRDIVMENPRSGLLKALGYGRNFAGWNRSQGQCQLPGGQMIYLGAADDGADRIQGKNLSGCLCDEIGMWERWEVAWDESIGYAVRIHPALIIAAGTPKSNRRARVLIKRLLEDPDVPVTQLRTEDNLANLSPKQRDEYEKRKGTRLGRQELEGDLLEDVEGALWSSGQLEADRVLVGAMPVLEAVVTAVDPAVSVTKTSDETGILTLGRGRDGHGYVLEDNTLKDTPGGWAREVWGAVLRHGSEAVVVEDNQGGDMVEHTLRIELDAMVPEFRRAGRMPPPIRRVHPGSRQGKRARATPIAELYERHRIHHVTDVDHDYDLSALEEQQTSWDGTGDSPDRVDALVHGATYLFLPGTARGAHTVVTGRWGAASGRR